jgi:hypothetical protein
MNNCYEANIKTIHEFNKLFEEKLLNEKEKEHENIKIINRKNFLIKLGSKEILAYPKNNEHKQANETFQNINLYNDECTILIGIGNGYLLNKLLQKSEKKHVLLLIEPIQQLINYAFENYNFSKYIKDGRLLICSRKEELNTILAFIDATKVIQLWHTVVDNYTVILQDIYSEITKLTMDLVNQIICNVGTIMGAGEIIAENDIKNLPYVIKHRGIKDIKNLFKGKPAIVILSAPTVTELLPQLLDKKIRERIIIIAIAQMLRPLLAFGIKPDFICSVDYGKVNYEHFDNLWHIKDIPFVALNRTYAPILEKWQGPKFIVTGFNPANTNTVVEMLNEKGQLDQGGSVGHMAIGLAVHLGCNPVIHIGFDCAYDPDKKLSHNKLGDAIGKIEINKDGSMDWNITDPLSSLKNQQKLGNAIWIPGYFEKPVPTNMGLASFVTSMENIFKSHPDIKFINSCEGGAKKKHCEQMSLKLALKKYCKRKINKNKLKKYLTLKPDYKKDIKETKKRLNWEIDLFKKEIDLCNKALKPITSMLNKNKKTELKKLLTENEKYAIEAQNTAKQSILLSLHIYKISRKIQSRELKVNGKTNHLLKDKKDLAIRVERSKLILEEAKKSSKKLLEIYNDVLKKLDNIENSVIENSNPKIDIKVWETLIDNGNWARPLLESEYLISNNLNNESYVLKIYEKCLNMRHKCILIAQSREDKTNEIEFNKYIELSKKYGKEKNFKLALKYIKKANKIIPDKIVALWGLATTYQYLGNIKKSITAYDKLCRLDVENLRFRFERGQVWLLKDLHRGLKILNRIVDKTHDFDSFCIRLAELEIGIKDFKNAKKHIDRYLEIYPHSLEAKKILGIINKNINSLFHL